MRVPGDDQRRLVGRDDLLEGGLVHADFIEAGGQVRFIKDAQHDFLTMNGRQNGNAQIEIPPTYLDAHTSVLRQAAFGNVEIRHDLET